ncbi:WAS/WASL-interacting protein family member 1-like [Pan paniscus]|uniref:WAS/WASL-interacting protein family member 1-like n=1 Tax=Pan paniscus TaxID=9597 RepID=UPI003007832C
MPGPAALASPRFARGLPRLSPPRRPQPPATCSASRRARRRLPGAVWRWRSLGAAGGGDGGRGGEGRGGGGAGQGTQHRAHAAGGGAAGYPRGAERRTAARAPATALGGRPPSLPPGARDPSPQCQHGQAAVCPHQPWPRRPPAPFTPPAQHPAGLRRPSSGTPLPRLQRSPRSPPSPSFVTFNPIPRTGGFWVQALPGKAVCAQCVLQHKQS